MGQAEIPIKKRTPEEMIEYTVERVAKMQIEEKYKLELVGLLTAIQTAIEN